MCLDSVPCVKRLGKKGARSLLWSGELLTPDPGLLQTLRDLAISFSGGRTKIYVALSRVAAEQARYRREKVAGLSPVSYRRKG